jgi:hypothetical protein
MDEYKTNNLTIYVGQTINQVEARMKQHQQNDTWFINKNIKQFEHSGTYSPNQARLIEDYLIEKFGSLYRSHNDKNKDGTIAHRGGVGESIDKVLHNFYIVFGPNYEFI